MNIHPRHHKGLLQTPYALLFGLSLLGVGALFEPSDVAATPPVAPETAPPATPEATEAATAAGSAPSAAPVAPAVDSAALKPAPSAESTSATIVFATSPPATATVVWGRKLLGKITPARPLVIVRPRDSGPLDVMVRAEGFLAVQTRAHTFSDNRVIVKLTLPENKSELFGYRAPLDAGVGPEQAAALEAVTPSTPSEEQGTTFRVVPVAPVPSPWLVPP